MTAPIDAWRVIFNRSRELRVTPADGQFDKPSLTGVEQRWLEARRRADERQTTDARPARSLQSRLHKAIDRWSIEAVWIAAGLQQATAQIPPPKQAARERRDNSISDPTMSQVAATVATIERETILWAHLAGPCRLNGQPASDTSPLLHLCDDDTIAAVARQFGIDLPHVDELVDGLLGTPVTSTVAFNDIVNRAATWHTTAATTIKQTWMDLWQSGCDSATLEHLVTETETVARRTATIAWRLAVWSGRQEPTCTSCGGLKPDNRNQCGKCRTAQWRDRTSRNMAG